MSVVVMTIATALILWLARRRGIAPAGRTTRPSGEPRRNSAAQRSGSKGRASAGVVPVAICSASSLPVTAESDAPHAVAAGDVDAR